MSLHLDEPMYHQEESLEKCRNLLNVLLHLVQPMFATLGVVCSTVWLIHLQKGKELRLQFVPSAVLFCKKVRSSSFYVGESTRSQSFLEIKKDMYQIYSILRKERPPTLGQTSR